VLKYPSQFNGKRFRHEDPSVLNKISCPNLRFYELRTDCTVPNIIYGLELRFPILFSVDLAFCDVIYCVDDLKKVPVVEITFCDFLEDISGLGENQSVCIRYCNLITSFAPLINVGKVSIYGCSGLSTGYDVKNVKELTLVHLPEFDDLVITQCKRLDRFEGLSNVADLDIDGILKELTHLGGPRQRRIVIYGMNLSSQFSTLSSLRSEYEIFDEHSALVLLRKRKVSTD
jgi:hypothetical protein